MNNQMAQHMVQAFGTAGFQASVLLGEPVDVVVRAFPDGEFFVNLSTQSGRTASASAVIEPQRIVPASHVPPVDESNGRIIRP